MIPYKSVEQVEHVESSLSTDMTQALELWYDLYLNRAPWVNGTVVKSLNLPAFVASELARQITLELKVNISGKSDGANLDRPSNARSEYLTQEFQRGVMTVLRTKLEQGCAAGGMVIKPYPNTSDGHIYFDWTMDWGIYPLSFDDDGGLADVVLPDTFTEGRTTYTRLERHKMTDRGVHITQRAFKSSNPNMIGTEADLKEVDRWASAEKEVDVKNTDGPLFGWYKVASANATEVNSPMGSSVYAKAVNIIKEADIQYSRLLWEYEGSELAIDVDPSVLRPRKVNVNGEVRVETPKLNERLFRSVDADKGDRDLYQVFSPNIRDANLVNGLNQLLMRVEDQCGLSRGTLSDANVDARTATELNIVRQRSYATVHDNQAALERCLRDVIRAMDKYATLYHLAPEGEYEVSFEWDDSIITDKSQELQERLMLFNIGVIGAAEMRMWYLGETATQAKQAIDDIQSAKQEEIKNQMEAQMSGQMLAQPTPSKQASTP